MWFHVKIIIQQTPPCNMAVFAVTTTGFKKAKMAIEISLILLFELLLLSLTRDGISELINFFPRFL